MKNLWKDFKAFIARGNVLDMAVGVIIGSAFGKIVTSLVNDILMPLLGLVTGGVDFNSKELILSPAEYDAAGTLIKEAASLKYGSFIQNVLDFLIIAFCIFMFTRGMAKITEKIKKPEPPKKEEPKKPTAEELLTEIRDLFKEKEN